jgi:hypothetical protein
MAQKSRGLTCRGCGGETAKGTLKAGNQEASVVIAGKPDGFLGVIPYSTSQITVRVCLSCGLIDTYARNVRDLLPFDDDTAGSDDH